MITAIPLAFTMNNMPDGPLHDQIYNYHESFGLLIWIIAVLRVLTRLAEPSRPYAPPISAFEKAVSGIVHALIYLLIFAMPIAGYIGVGAYPANPFFFFGELPNYVPQSWRSEDISNLILRYHRYAGILLTVLVVLHISAALMHGIVKRDSVLSRMLPGAR